MTATEDPVLISARERIMALDEQLVAVVNDRIAAVSELRRHKELKGLPFVDRERELWLAEHLRRVNGGPLSERGVEELITFVLALVKREVARV